MKQVLVVNGSLGLPAGKLAAQVAHASIGAFLSADQAQQRQWLDAGMPKIVLEGSTAEFIGAVQQSAREAGIPTFLVRDAGRTVIAAGTVTCLGIGPASAKDIDVLTGALPLLK
jgi:peptidyl-tRNA hydrolase, PTH2 family